MTCRVTLPIWPDSFHCLSWSKDNLIAVGGGDQIAILTPRLKEPGPDGSYWSYAFFKANAFTADEAPLFEPLSFKSFSVGEELSSRHVEALEWSSPGLARYGRCALAVLSSNHVLSFWECDGRPDVAANWRRKTIVNHVLQRFYQDLGRKDNESVQDHHERMRVSQRVRTFTWSPALYPGLSYENTQQPFPSLYDRSHQFLAVSTEAEDILLLRVSPSCDILMPGANEWNVEVTHCFNSRSLARDALQSGPSNGELDPLACGNTSFIADHLAWSPWKLENGSLEQFSTLAFVANCQLFSVIVGVAANNDLAAPKTAKHSRPKHLIASRSDIMGPLSFVPETNLLMAFAADNVFCLGTSAADLTESSDLTNHHLDDRWDEITGLAFTNRHDKLPDVHILSHLSAVNAPTTTLGLPLNPDETSSRPSWQDAIADSKEGFSEHKELDGHVQARTWGIASSPLGEYVVTATTMLPSDSLQYITASDQRTVVNFNFEAKDASGTIVPINERITAASDATAEALLFSFQRYLDLQHEVVGRDTLVNAMSHVKAVSEGFAGFDSEKALSSGKLEPLQIVRYLRLRMFTLTDLVTKRLELFADIALRRVSDANQIFQPVVRHLISETDRLPEGIEQAGELSNKIRKVYKAIQSKLELQGTSGKDNTQFQGSSEECRICQKSVYFESVKWAKCEGGHQFSRCALTFLAIQEPGISKHCTICGSQFLNEWSLPQFTPSAGNEDVDMELLPHDRNSKELSTAEVRPMRDSHAESVEIEPPASLARILFAAFDTCIYCGGKFVT